MTRYHTVPVIPSRYENEIDHWDTPSEFNRANDGSWTVYRMRSGYVGKTISASLTYVGPKGKCRRENYGPILPGPYADVIPLSGVLSDYRQARPSSVVEIAEGDIVEFQTSQGSQAFRVVDDRRTDYPRFEPVSVTFAHDNCQQCIDQLPWAYAHAAATGSIGADAEKVGDTSRGSVVTHRAMYRRL